MFNLIGRAVNLMRDLRRYHLCLFIKNILFWLSRTIDFPLVSPDTIQLNFLFRCNLRCKMCKMETRDTTKEIPLDMLKKLVLSAKDIGIKNVLILGGEPFLREDLFDLVEYIKQKNMISIVVTNGTLLTEKILEKAMNSGLSHLCLSIDGSNDRVLSSIRGEGVFERIVLSIEKFMQFKERYNDFHIEINNCVTIMEENIEDLYNIVILSKKLGLKNVVFQPVVPDNTDQIKVGISANPRLPIEKIEIIEHSINKLIEFKKSNIENFNFIINSIKNLELIKKYFNGTISRRERECYAGFNRIQITQDLKIYFCVSPQGSNEASFGNLRTERLKDIWYSSKAKKYRKVIRKAKCCCLQRCSFRDEFENVESIFEKLALFGRFY